ncbi:outer membrane protein [Algoriphagus sp. AK58]|uniref:outer membrane protein n=1 Tax=Algoriphagus sp. AK58 TaxID=1406877 RepID=UPI0016506CE3|nr:outer membrane beta-barrel protein [Algoriphagus sp. AK58]MBC6365230.1 hypothetical protein [Algoriphagus sp. AK58]
MKKYLFPLFLISATAFGQINPIPTVKPKIENDQALNFKPIKGFYLTASVGDSWESPITNNRKDETVSPTLGPITYERVSEKRVSGAGSIEAGLGYNFEKNLRVELTYLYKAKSANSEISSGTVFYSGGEITFNGTTEITGKLNKHSVLANLYYDIPTKSRWVPFIGAGLGLARINSTDMLYDYDIVYSNGNRVVGSRTEPGGIGNALAYQTKLGINYMISKKTSVLLTGNYFHINRINLGGGTVYEGFNVFGAKVGFIYRFSKNTPI